jgi:hypothetical protein
MTSKNISKCKFGKNSNIIRNLYNSKNRGNLIKLLVKTLSKTDIKYNKIPDLINIIKLPIIKYIHESNSDSKIINSYVNLIKNVVKLYDNSHNKKRAQRLWVDVEKRIPYNLQIKRILDFGGNIGNQAYAIGNILKLKKSQILVVDIDEWEGQKWIPRKDITFIHYDKMKTIKSNSVDFINARHVLHHINPAEHTHIINHFNRILTKNGFIVVSEHGMENTTDSMIDLLHLLFGVVVSQVSDYKKFCKSYYAQYYPKKYWINLFKNKFKLYDSTDYKVVDSTVTLYFNKKNNIY